MVEAEPLPEPQKEKPREEMKVEQPPDEAPSLVPIPVVKPPEKVENSPPPAPQTAQQVKGGAPRIEASWEPVSSGSFSATSVIHPGLSHATSRASCC